MNDQRKTVTLTEDMFDERVLRADHPVLVDFWASWCGPCRAIAPALEELAARFDGQVTIGKVDVDAQPALAERFGVRSIPTLILFKGGTVIDQAVGVVPKHMLAAKLQAAIDQPS